MAAFSTFEPAIASNGGELLLVQNGDPKRLPFSALGSGVPMSAAPPENSPLWWQTDAAGQPMELWMRGPGNLWLSYRQWTADYYRGSSNASFGSTHQNPCPGSTVWLESFTARARMRDQPAGAVMDFKLSFLSVAQQEVPYFYFRLEEMPASNFVNFFEQIAQPIDISDALAIRFTTKATGGVIKLGYISFSVVLRKIYAES